MDRKPLQFGDPQLVIAYSAAHEARKKPTPGTPFSLIGDHKASSEFTKKAQRTKKDYLRFLKMIEAEFGNMPIVYLGDIKARGKFKKWRDGMANNPRKADYGWGLLARVLSVAKDRDAISVNVCERGGKLYSVDRAEIIWQAEHIKAFGVVASSRFVSRTKEIPSQGAFLRSSVHSEQIRGPVPGLGNSFAITPSKMPL